MQSSASHNDTKHKVISLVTKLTRLPGSLVTGQADFEDDLGIDSVKGGEIVARLAEEFSLPPDQSHTLSAHRCVDDLAAHLTSMPSVITNQATPAVAIGAEAAPTILHSVPNTQKHDVDIVADLRALVARTTRLPEALVTEDADFEDDLGIDSVTLGRIRAEYNTEFPQLPWPDAVHSRSLKELASELSGARPPAAAMVADVNVSTLTAPDKPSQEDQFLRDKVVLISGSGHGLGREIALYLAQKGACVVVNSFHQRQLGDDVVNEIQQRGGQAIHSWGSFAKQQQIERIVEEAEDAFGGIDFYIHNASNGRFAKLADAMEEDFAKALNTNVLGLHYTAQAVAKSMKRRGGGRIIGISATYAHQHMDYFGVLGPAKVAAENYLGFLAKELLADNIQVNSLVAGAIEGEVMTHYPEHDRIVGMTEQASQGGRRCTEAELAAMVGLLLRPEASIMTGASIVADRGMLLR